MPPTADTIQTIAAFQQNSTQILNELNTTGRPITLVAGGHPVAILQSPAEYQRLRDLAAEALADEGIRQGLEELHTGEGRPVSEFLEEMRAKYVIPR